ncbi:septum formation initiator family protein [Lutibacter sp. B2]|nr:septum formation initiator family protein [Lutibacter sp. B2]
MNEGKKNKKKIKIVHIFLACAVLYVSWIFIRTQIDISRLEKQEIELNKKITELKKTEKSLVEEQKSAGSIKYIEKVAREELKMVKSNEIIYIDSNKTNKKQ